MKKSSFSAALLLIGIGVSGCPVYDGSDVGCFDDLDCPASYVCDQRSSACVSDPGGVNACNEPADCGTNETCSRSGSCEVGDCHFASVGCVRGFECSSASGRWECIEEDADAASGGAPNAGSAATGGAAEPTNASGASN